MIDKKLLAYITENEFFYYFLFFSLFFVIFLFLYLFNIIPIIDANTSRYILSSLIQSLAAVIAVIVSLTLVGVQILSQKYASEIFEYFRRNQSVWIVIIIYLISIFICTISLSTVKESNFYFLSIWVPIFLGLFSFSILIPYFWFITESFSPINMIKNVEKESQILLKKIKSIDYDNKDKIHEDFNEKLNLIFNIIKGSINFDSNATATALSSSLFIYFNYLTKLSSITSDYTMGVIQNISTSYITKITTIGLQSSEIINKETAIYYIHTIHKLMDFFVFNEDSQNIKKMILLYEDFGKKVLIREDYFASTGIFGSLVTIIFYQNEKLSSDKMIWYPINRVFIVLVLLGVEKGKRYDLILVPFLNYIKWLNPEDFPVIIEFTKAFLDPKMSNHLDELLKKVTSIPNEIPSEQVKSEFETKFKEAGLITEILKQY